MLLPGGATLTGQKSPLKPTRQMHRHIHSAALQRNGFAFPRRLPRQTGQNTPGGISIARRASRSLAEITASCQRTVRAIFIAVSSAIFSGCQSTRPVLPLRYAQRGVKA